MSSRAKYDFVCNVCHNFFNMAPIDIARGKWCPTCCSELEFKLFAMLKVTFPDITRQFRAPWCATAAGDQFSFDFIIPSRRVIIELDDEQPFPQVFWWTSPEQTNICDKFKMLCAWRNGYTVIRVPRNDIRDNRVDMKQLSSLICNIASRSEIQRQMPLLTLASEQAHMNYSDLRAFCDLFVTNPAITIDINGIL